MELVYGAISGICLIILVFFSGYRKKFFKTLNKKEHPLKGFYPGAARILDVFRKIVPRGKNTKTTRMIKSICVKENVEGEQYLYSVKKTATCLVIIFLSSIMGLLICFTKEESITVKTLERNQPGGGTGTYNLKTEYGGEEDEIEISVDAEKYKEEEILKKFDESIESIKEEIKGDNESLDAVSSPLNLITKYGDISIYWETENLDILDYNGNIKNSPADGEQTLINLYATLTLDNVSETFTVPVVLVPKEQTEREILIQSIQKSIEENNSVYEKQVDLPEEVNGKQIVFRKPENNDDVTIFILSLIAVIAIVLGYDKSLERKVKKRQDEMLMDFTEIVSKLSLLYEAGLSLYKAWERVVIDYEEKNKDKPRYAYREMRLTIEMIRSGMSEKEAYGQFGQRCGLHSYIKLGNILEQNLSKGTKGMKDLLKQEVSEAFEERKRLARKKGEEAGTKLLFPMVLLLLITVIMVAVPALMNIPL